MDKPAYKKDWVLTGPALEKLLATLEAAGVGYLEMRERLVKYFAYNRIADADEMTDVTLDRAARRMEEGEEVRNPVSYITGIARFVLKERWAGANVDQLDEQAQLPDMMPDQKQEAEDAKRTLDQQLDCLDSCVGGLLPAERERIIDYYCKERREKIDRRKQIAEELGITLINLRVRMHRTRKELEQCVVGCLEAAGEEMK